MRSSCSFLWTNDITEWQQPHEPTLGTQPRKIHEKRTERQGKRIHEENSNNEMEWRKITLPMGYGDIGDACMRCCRPLSTCVLNAHVVAYLQTTRRNASKRIIVDESVDTHTHTHTGEKRNTYFKWTFLRTYSHAHEISSMQQWQFNYAEKSIFSSSVPAVHRPYLSTERCSENKRNVSMIGLGQFGRCMGPC